MENNEKFGKNYECMASFLLASGWLVLDVTRAVRLWQKDYRTNQGLMVEITEIGTGHQVHFAQIHSIPWN